LLARNTTGIAMADAQPKKPLSAYWLWLAENRGKVADEIGTKQGALVGKAAGAKWKALPDAAKLPFEEKAKELKAKYDSAMLGFKDAGGEVAKRQPKAAQVKTKRDPDKPKKPSGGAYGCFVKESREEILKSLPPGSRITDVAKEAGKRWKALSEAARKPYEEMYQAALAAYQARMEEYKAKGGNVEEELETDGEKESPATDKKRKASTEAGDEATGVATESPAKRGRGRGRGRGCGAGASPVDA